MKTIEQWITVPIYDVRVLVVISDDIGERRAAHANIFGDCEKGKFQGSCVDMGGVCGLFFWYKYYTVNTLAHEVFHLTTKIFNIIGDSVVNDHQEAAAYLHGWLMDELFIIKKPKIPQMDKATYKHAKKKKVKR
jgi:hypothetical protein